MAEEKASSKFGGINLFGIGGIQIRLDYSWFIVFFLVIWSLSVGYFPHYFPDQSPGVYWLAGAIATILFFFSILAHELSHSFMAIRSGIHIPAITLFIFGGVAHIAEEAKDAKTEFKIAVVGPAMSFALAALFWLIQRILETNGASIQVVIFEYLAWINLALGIFNLVPGFPLDGGRIFRAFWWWKTGSLENATRIASDIGKGFAVTLMILGGIQIFAGALLGGIWLIFIGMFLRGIAEGGYQQLMLEQMLGKIKAEEIMITEPVTVPAGLDLERAVTDYFLRYGYRGFPVVEKDEIIGVLSLKDVKKIPEEERAGTLVKQAMEPLRDEIKIARQGSLGEALKKMNAKEIGRILVMDNGNMAGMITHTQLLHYLELRKSLEA